MVEDVQIQGAFKESELGMIPDDWDVKSLENEVDLLTGFPFPSNKYSETGIRLLRGSNVKRGVTEWAEDNTKYWKEVTPELKEYVLKDGDIVIAMDGSLVGKSFARLSSSDLPALLLQRIARVRSSKIDMGYLKEFICSDYFTKYCDSVKTASAIPHISPKDIRNFKIPLPPTKEEQDAIATALNDTDKLISQLEKLIAKKKLIKQGALQELLRPKEGWEMVELGKLFEITSSKRVFQSEWKSKGIPFYRARELAVLAEKGEVDNQLFITQEMYESFKRKHGVPQVGDILVTGVGTLGKVYLVKDSKPFYFKDGNIIWFKINRSVDSEYLKQLYFTKFIEKQIDDASGKTTVGTYTISGAKKTIIPIPPHKSEQIQIGKILSDIDNEIHVLEKKLNKYKMIKQGMMQNLLTGKIRLV